MTACKIPCAKNSVYTYGTLPKEFHQKMEKVLAISCQDILAMEEIFPLI